MPAVRREIQRSGRLARVVQRRDLCGRLGASVAIAALPSESTVPIIVTCGWNTGASYSAATLHASLRALGGGRDRGTMARSGLLKIFIWPNDQWCTHPASASPRGHPGAGLEDPGQAAAWA
jgi:hypothetical protein